MSFKPKRFTQSGNNSSDLEIRIKNGVALVRGQASSAASLAFAESALKELPEVSQVYSIVECKDTGGAC